MKLAQKPKAKPRKPTQRARGALTTIGGLMIASALIRVATGANEAIAKETAEVSSPTPPAETASTQGLDSPQGFTKSDIAPVINALRKREERVRRRETEVEIRVQALAVAETEINKQLKRLELAEAKLKATMSLAQSAAENDLAKLTAVYATMKPKQAAALFQEMDPKFAAGFLGRMPADAAAAILAGLSAEHAYTISVVLAGRNANAPKPDTAIVDGPNE